MQQNVVIPWNPNNMPLVDLDPSGDIKYESPSRPETCAVTPSCLVAGYEKQVRLEILDLILQCSLSITIVTSQSAETLESRKDPMCDKM